MFVHDFLSHEYFVQRKRKAFFYFKDFSFPAFFGCDLVNNSIEWCWKTDPIFASQAPFSFYFLLFQIQFLCLVGTNISNSIYPFQFQFHFLCNALSFFQQRNNFRNKIQWIILMILLGYYRDWLMLLRKPNKVNCKLHA